jgi:hypothetical protein
MTYGLSTSRPPSTSDSDSVDTTDDSQYNTPGLFDDINFAQLAELNDIDRRKFLDSATDSILELYTPEWRDILDEKLVHYLQENPTAHSSWNPRRARNLPLRDCVLPSDTLPIPMSLLESKTHHGSFLCREADLSYNATLDIEYILVAFLETTNLCERGPTKHFDSYVIDTW